MRAFALASPSSPSEIHIRPSLSVSGIRTTRTRSAAGVTRIAPVYTPPECRGRGYAAAATAAATEDALDSGATGVCLFTDLANPLTNRLYPRVGYRPVEDRLMIPFD